MSGSPEKGTECGQGCHRIEVPSDEEVRALNAMREIKKKVRELLKTVSLLSPNKPDEHEELRNLELEMERLKKEWEGWEEKRREAAKLRMILLGHEEPD